MPTMEQSVRSQRKRTNVDFLDENGQTFAGLYVLQSSSRTVAGALDMLKASFNLTFSGTSEKSNDKKQVWAIYPYRGQFSNEAFSLDKVLAKGRYYVVCHLESSENTGALNDHSAMNHVLGQCCSRVQQVVPKIPGDYRPMIMQPSPTYELSQDGTWEGTTRAQGTIPQNLWRAEEAMKGFHSLSNTSGRCCAISGLGRYAPENSKLAWSDPGLTISHIIPPQHFDVYPIDKSDIDGEDDELAEKWRMTWDPRENGIVLLGHFHALWKARLVAVEPDSLTTRCFGPYDSIAAYEGQKAHFSNVPNRGALRWHYDMCIFENITAKQPPQSLATKQYGDTTAVIRAALSTSSVTPQGIRPRKRPRTDQGGAISPQLSDNPESSGDPAKPLCTLECILCLGDPAGSDPSCPNFSKHRRLGFGTAVHKLDIAAMREWGLVRDEDVPKDVPGRESIISEYEIVSRESIPILRVVLPYGYTVIGKGIVHSDHSKEPAFGPEMEADVLMKLGSQLAGECVPFCLGVAKLGKELRDPTYDGPIQQVLLLSSAEAPLSEAPLPRREKIMRTVKDIRNHGVRFREPLVESDLRWNEEAQRVMVVNFAGATIEAIDGATVFR